MQDPPRGTGDATRIALSVLPEDGVTLVGLGDVPLVPASGLAAIVEHARRGDVGLLTARVADPSGPRADRARRLGRRAPDRRGARRDRRPSARSTRSTPASSLRPPRCSSGWVAQLTPHNAQGEFYLTDIVAMAVAEGVPVSAHVATDEREVRGVNDRAQLAFAERSAADRAARMRCSRRGRGSPIRRASISAARSPAAVMCGSTWAACSRATCARRRCRASARTACCAT